jgi:hypothetical protein
VCKARFEERSKGAARKIASNHKIKGLILRFLGLGYLLICIFLRRAIIPGGEPRLIIINISQYWFSLRGF